MIRGLVVLAFSVAAVNAFAPQPQTSAVTLTRQNGYVPDGLTAAEWEKQRKAQAEKDKQNKSRFPKGKKFVDIGAWLGDLEQKQALKGEKIVGSGHTFAKQKFETKEDYDKTKGRK